MIIGIKSWLCIAPDDPGEDLSDRRSKQLGTSADSSHHFLQPETFSSQNSKLGSHQMRISADPSHYFLQPETFMITSIFNLIQNVTRYQGKWGSEVEQCTVRRSGAMLCCIFLPRLRHTFATSYHLDTSYHIEYITSCDISQSVKLREGVKNCEKAVTLTERGAQGVTHTHTHC